MNHKWEWPALLLGFGLVMQGLAAAPTPPAIKLVSPQDYQVFQRQSLTQGVVVVEGKAPSGMALEARLGATAWRPLSLDLKTSTFRAELQAPAGGWYKLEVRALAGGKVVAETMVEHVGVGEVFLVAGQSNSANYGAEKQRPATDRVVSFDGATWRIANDPQRGAGGNNGSFMPAFGDALVEKYNVPVGVAPCGIGSTSVRQWLPAGVTVTNSPTISAFMKAAGPGVWVCTGQAFNGLMMRAKKLGPHGFRAILWHQGESDCLQKAGHNITGEQYRHYLEQVISTTRKQAGWEIPWFVAQVSYHNEKDATNDELRAAQKALWDAGVAMAGPDTDTLRREYRAGVHFNSKGLQTHGRLWAEKVGGYLDKMLRP